MKLVLALFLVTASPAVAQITTVGPFVGDMSEGFEAHPSQFGMTCLFPRIFGDRGDLCSPGSGGFISVAPGFGQLGPSTGHGGAQFARSGLGGAVISFDAPVQTLGGYFAAESGVTGGLAMFYDVSGNYIGQHTWSVLPCTSNCPWVWNGWDAGNGPRIASMRMTGTFPGSDGPYMDDLVAQAGSPATGTFFCNGDGSVHPCPCTFGTQLPPRGCPNSSGPGARLSAGGVARLTADSVELYASGMGGAAYLLFFQGTAVAAGEPSFGEGLRCVGGTLVRLGSHAVVNGTAQFPSAGDPPLHVRGQIASAGLRMYQVKYREAAPQCLGVRPFNLTNGYQILWVP